MRRICALLLTLFLLLCSFAACGEPGRPAPETRETETAVRETETAFDPALLDTVHPALWRVTGPEGETLYLFGTIHLGDERSLAALENVRPYLDTCDALAVEFDTVAYQRNLSQAARDMANFVYTDGTTIRDHLPGTLYEEARQYLKDARMYSALYDRYNVAMWSQLLDQALLSEGRLDTEKAMDSLLLGYAYEKDLEILELESASFQYRILLETPEEVHILSMREVLGLGKLYAEQVELMYDCWCRGDPEAMMDSSSTSGDMTYTEEQIRMLEDYENAMIHDRNAGMAEKAAGYLESGKTVFLAVGAGHMIGETGLVNTLETAGYTVERIGT